MSIKIEKKSAVIFEDGGRNTYIRDAVIPKMIKIIEESGLSFADAGRVPEELSQAISAAGSKLLVEARFTDITAAAEVEPTDGSAEGCWGIKTYKAGATEAEERFWKPEAGGAGQDGEAIPEKN